MGEDNVAAAGAGIRARLIALGEALGTTLGPEHRLKPVHIFTYTANIHNALPVKQAPSIIAAHIEEVRANFMRQGIAQDPQLKSQLIDLLQEWEALNKRAYTERFRSTSTSPSGPFSAR